MITLETQKAPTIKSVLKGLGTKDIKEVPIGSPVRDSILSILAKHSDREFKTKEIQQELIVLKSPHSNGIINKHLLELNKNGLVKIDKKTTKGGKKTYQITKKGMKLAPGGGSISKSAGGDGEAIIGDDEDVSDDEEDLVKDDDDEE